MKYLRLKGKTNKGKNKINEAGKPGRWVLIEQRDSVGFSDREGPWLHVYPDNNENVSKSRWVHATDDRDFTVELIP